MTPQVLSSQSGAQPRDRRWPGTGLYRFVVERFLFLPIGVAIAMLWAQLQGESYFRIAHALKFPVNEIGMALFLALVTQDVIEAVMPGGALHTWRRWAAAVAAAAGGIVGAAGVFLAFTSLAHETVLWSAWPVACAVDLVSGYYVLRTICHRHCGAIPFLVLSAAVADAVAIAIQVTWAPFSTRQPTALTLLLVAVGLAEYFRRRGFKAFWPYLAVCGPLAWTSLYLAGIHPALALVPLVPFMPHVRRRSEIFAEPVDTDEVHRTERRWHDIVQIVLLFFGLVNGGVLWRGYDTGTWALLVAALVGRPAGVLLATAAAVAGGLRLPGRVGWPELIVAAFASGIGFTFALFFASGFLPPGAVLTQITFGALLTVAGVPVTLGVAKVLGVGRRTHRAGIGAAVWHTSSR